jgi:hypothetical protein
VIYDGQENSRSIEDTFFRIMLFKWFNLPSSWELYDTLGEMTFRPGILEKIDEILTTAINSGARIWSNAYMITGSGSKGKPKHRMYLGLLNQWMKDGMPRKMAEAKNMEEGFKILRSSRLVGDFIAMQFAIDWNYSPLVDWSESEFMAAGPGTERGIQKCFTEIGSTPYIDIIRYMTENQEDFCRTD